MRALPDRRALAAVLMIGAMTVVRYKVEKGIAWLAMNNPPLNALSHALRAGSRGMRSIARSRTPRFAPW